MSIAQDIRHAALYWPYEYCGAVESHVLHAFLAPMECSTGSAFDPHWPTFMLLCAEALDELPREEMRLAATFTQEFPGRIFIHQRKRVVAVLREAAR